MRCCWGRPLPLSLSLTPDHDHDHGVDDATDHDHDAAQHRVGDGGDDD